MTKTPFAQDKVTYFHEWREHDAEFPSFMVTKIWWRTDQPAISKWVETVVALIMNVLVEISQ